MLNLFAWHGHGNLGDDWLAETGLHLLADLSPTPVSERRTLIGAGRRTYRLRAVRGRVDTRTPLVLWGGGWLAGDQGDATLHRWAHHLDTWHGPVYGFGLGLGPFREATRDLAGRVLSAFEQPLYVRTVGDVDEAARLGVSAELAVDPSVLWTPSPQTTSADLPGDYTVVALPPYGRHWSTFENEQAFRRYATELVPKYTTGPVIFLSFQTDHGHATDHAFWRNEFPRTAPVASIGEAASIIAGARCVVAGRLHAGMLASVLGVPAVGLAYHHKFGQLAELEVPVLDPRTTSIADLPEPRAASAERLAAVRERAARAVSGLRQCLISSQGLSNSAESVTSGMRRAG